MSAEFADTNVVLYLLDEGPKANRAEFILGQGPRISVQVLNEFVHVARRKFGHDWPQIEFALDLFRASLDDVVPVTLNTHAGAIALAREWLGRPGLVEGADADLVVYGADPREDVTVIAEPKGVVLRGRVVL